VLKDNDLFQPFGVDPSFTPDSVRTNEEYLKNPLIRPVFLKWNEEEQQFIQVAPTSSFEGLTQVFCIEQVQIWKLSNYDPEIFQKADEFYQFISSFPVHKNNEAFEFLKHPLWIPGKDSDRDTTTSTSIKYCYRKDLVEEMTNLIFSEEKNRGIFGFCGVGKSSLVAPAVVEKMKKIVEQKEKEIVLYVPTPTCFKKEDDSKLDADPSKSRLWWVFAYIGTRHLGIFSFFFEIQLR